jgi:uncharacterized protein YndB with AHSA1/START domain
VATITSSIVIQRPVAEVFAFVTDARNNPRWQAQSGLRQTIQEPESPVGVGTRITEVWHFMGRDASSLSEVTAYVPNQRYVRTQVSSSGPIAWGELRVEPVAGGTRLTSSATLRASGLMVVLLPLMARMLHRAHGASQRTLKRLLEAAPVEQPQRTAR